MQAEIREAGHGDMDQVRRLFGEYRAWLEGDVCFQGFAAELAGLPGEYAAPTGGLWVVSSGAQLVACIALRTLAPGVVEIKRLYVQPAHRGHGHAQHLLQRALDCARAMHARKVVLETLPDMAAAQRLYAQCGFVRTTGPAEAADSVERFELSLDR